MKVNTINTNYSTHSIELTGAQILDAISNYIKNKVENNMSIASIGKEEYRQYLGSIVPYMPINNEDIYKIEWKTYAK